MEVTTNQDGNGAQTLSTTNGDGTTTGTEHAAVWTFLTNHAHVLICLARNPELRLRDVADMVGITERAVQRIVAELEEARILTRTRDGRRNHYQIHANLPLRHSLEAHRTVRDLLDVILKEGSLSMK